MPDSQGNAEDRDVQGNRPRDAQGNNNDRDAQGNTPRDSQGNETSSRDRD